MSTITPRRPQIDRSHEDCTVEEDPCHRYPPERLRGQEDLGVSAPELDLNEAPVSPLLSASPYDPDADIVVRFISITPVNITAKKE